VETAHTVTARRTRGGHATPRVAPYLFLTPALALFLFALLLPIAYTFYLSVMRQQISGLGFDADARELVFVGLDNYLAALTHPQLVASVGRALVYGGLLVPTMLGLALLFALLLDHARVRFANFSRLAIFLPYAVPGVIATLLWGFLYLPQISPFHHLLDQFGLPAVDLLGSRSVFAALANIGVWGGTGFNMIIIYTALRALPREVLESARVDGCSEFQLALRVKLPLVFPAVILTAIFAIITTLQVYTEPETLSPLTSAIFSTWSPMMKVYRDAFVQNDLYLAAATSLILAVGIFAISFGFLRLVHARAFGEDR
jgi:multiple sugar transport system permease protein